jgi:hypothetical protein
MCVVTRENITHLVAPLLSQVAILVCCRPRLTSLAFIHVGCAVVTIAYESHSLGENLK